MVTLSKFQVWNGANNMFLNKCIINKFCYAFVSKFWGISISVKHFLRCFNLKMKLGKVISNCEAWVYTKPNLYSSATELLKLVYTPFNKSFLKTLVANLPFYLQIITSRKEKELFFFSFKWKFNIFVSFVHVINKLWNFFWFFKQHKNVINLSFIIHWFERF